MRLLNDGRGNVNGDDRETMALCPHCLDCKLSVGSRLPGITWHSALWSPDFPPPSNFHRGQAFWMYESLLLAQCTHPTIEIEVVMGVGINMWIWGEVEVR